MLSVAFIYIGNHWESNFVPYCCRGHSSNCQRARQPCLLRQAVVYFQARQHRTCSGILQCSGHLLCPSRACQVLLPIYIPTDSKVHLYGTFSDSPHWSARLFALTIAALAHDPYLGHSASATRCTSIKQLRLVKSTS